MIFERLSALVSLLSVGSLFFDLVRSGLVACLMMGLMYWLLSMMFFLW